MHVNFAVIYLDRYVKQSQCILVCLGLRIGPCDDGGSIFGFALIAVSDGSRVWFSNDTPESTALHGISPRPVKKMSFKTGPKQRANIQPTPPDSPRYK